MIFYMFRLCCLFVISLSARPPSSWALGPPPSEPARRPGGRPEQAPQQNNT